MKIFYIVTKDNVIYKTTFVQFLEGKLYFEYFTDNNSVETMRLPVTMVEQIRTEL